MKQAYTTSILESMLDAVIVANPDGTIRTLNRAAFELLGYSKDEIIGQPVGTIFEEEDDDDFFRDSGLAQLVREGAARDVEMTLRTCSGKRVPVTFNGSVIREEDGCLAAVVGVARDLRERKRAEEQIKAALAEKEVLLHELHHRVKNNMQAETQAPETIYALKELQGQVRAMSMVHEKLYQAQNLAQIDFRDYVQDLTAHLHHALARGRPIALHVDTADEEHPADIFIDVNIAAPCGLIVNELVSNTLKYAFPEEREERGEKRNEIRVGFGLQEGEYVLTVSDNGVGLPPELDWRAAESLGLKLVNVWATYQLQGSLEVDTQDGTTFTVRFAERK